SVLLRAACAPASRSAKSGPTIIDSPTVGTSSSGLQSPTRAHLGLAPSRPGQSNAPPAGRLAGGPCRRSGANARGRFEHPLSFSRRGLRREYLQLLECREQRVEEPSLQRPHGRMIVVLAQSAQEIQSR